MKLSRSLQRILILGETHFVGRALMIQLLKQNLEVQIWVTEANVIEELPNALRHRVHLLKASTQKDLVGAWQIYSWDTVLHIVSIYEENGIGYKTTLQNQKGLIGGAILEIVQSTFLEPLYVEIETDWVFDEAIEEIEEEAEEADLVYLDSYANQITIETTNILSPGMQPNHWIFSFIKSLENKTNFGVPCSARVLRDWIALEDYAEAIHTILIKGKSIEQYTVVGFNEWTNYDLMLLIGAMYDRRESRENGTFKYQLCNELISCRQSYKETKIGLSYLELNSKYVPQAMYDIIDDVIEAPLSLVTKV